MRNIRGQTLLTMLLATACAIALSGCGREVIVARDRDPAMVAKAATIDVWVKDANGKLVMAKRRVEPGEFVIGDSNAAKAPASRQGD